MARTVALVMAAGRGSRAGDGTPKQYRRLAGKAVLAHAVDHLPRLPVGGLQGAIGGGQGGAPPRRPPVDAIQVVIGDGQDEAYREAIGDRSLPAPVTGGATRRLSVVNGLDALARAGGVERVLIHDAARPPPYPGVW